MIRNLARAHTFVHEEKQTGTMPEETSACAEEPEQRLSGNVEAKLAHHERIRLFIIGSALFFMLLSFLLFLFTRTFLPLFGMIIVAYLLYDNVDSHLRKTEM